MCLHSDFRSKNFLSFDEQSSRDREIINFKKLSEREDQSELPNIGLREGISLYKDPDI